MASVLAEHEQKCGHRIGNAQTPPRAAMPLKPSGGRKLSPEQVKAAKEGATDVMTQLLGSLGFEEEEEGGEVEKEKNEGAPSVTTLTTTRTCPFCGTKMPASESKAHDEV